MPPSPTAAAQRLTEPERTSPAAKIPGMLVSSGPGARLLLCQAERVGNRRASLDETLRVALDLWRQPVGAGFRTDHGKHGRCLNGSAFARLSILDLDRLQHFPAAHRADLSMVKDLNVFFRLDPAREVTRHALREIVSPYDEEYLCRALREIHRCLPGGIAGSGDDHRGATAELSFERGGSVVDARAFEFFATLGFDAAVIRASGDEHTLGVQAGVATLDLQTGAIFFILVQCDGECLRRGGEFRAEAISLELREIGEVPSVDPGGESKEILDQRGRTGLPARRVAFEHDRLKTFRTRINGGRQAGRSRTNDRQVAADLVRRLQSPADAAAPRFAQPRAGKVCARARRLR